MLSIYKRKGWYETIDGCISNSLKSEILQAKIISTPDEN